MTTPDYRAELQLLVDACTTPGEGLDVFWDAVDRAETALSQPPAEFEKPTSQEFFALWAACNSPSVFGRMVLERWGNLPVPSYPNPENQV